MPVLSPKSRDFLGSIGPVLGAGANHVFPSAQVDRVKGKDQGQILS